MWLLLSMGVEIDGVVNEVSFIILLRKIYLSNMKCCESFVIKFF